MITGQEVWNMMSSYGSSSWPSMWSLGAFSLAFILFFLLVGLGVWIYTSFAYMEIAKKLKYKNPWLAWIPFARGAMILQLGNFPWGWVFLWSPLALLPLAYFTGASWWLIFSFLAFAGAIAFSVLCYISHWRFFERRGYYGWLALVSLVGAVVPYIALLAGIAFLVILGFVAWKDGTMVRKSSARARAPRARSKRSSGRKRKR